MKARLAFSAIGGRPGYDVTFTPRGNRYGEGFSQIIRGFIRLNGKTISGYAYDGGGPLVVFYAEGINAPIAREVTLNHVQKERVA